MHRCRSKQIFVVKRIFAQTSPKSCLVTFADRYFGVIYKKWSLLVFCKCWAPFLPRFSGICPNFQRFCSNVQGFRQDFQEIKTFGVVLALPVPPPSTPLVVCSKMSKLASWKEIVPKLVQPVNIVHCVRSSLPHATR